MSVDPLWGELIYAYAAARPHATSDPSGAWLPPPPGTNWGGGPTWEDDPIAPIIVELPGAFVDVVRSGYYRCYGLCLLGPVVASPLDDLFYGLVGARVLKWVAAKAPRVQQVVTWVESGIGILKRPIITTATVLGEVSRPVWEPVWGVVGPYAPQIGLVAVSAWSTHCMLKCRAEHGV